MILTDTTAVEPRALCPMASAWQGSASRYESPRSPQSNRFHCPLRQASFSLHRRRFKSSPVRTKISEPRENLLQFIERSPELCITRPGQGRAGQGMNERKVEEKSPRRHNERAMEPTARRERSDGPREPVPHPFLLVHAIRVHREQHVGSRLLPHERNRLRTRASQDEFLRPPARLSPFPSFRSSF